MVKFDIEDCLFEAECDYGLKGCQGGQHVAKPCAGVRVTHKPTGKYIVVNTERSRFANKAAGLALLREEVERVQG